MRKKIFLLISVLLISTFLCSCSDHPVGFYRLRSITAGDVVMDEADAKSLSMDLGSVKLQKSGKCQLNIMGEKHKGTWEEKEGKLTVKCGDDIYEGKAKNRTVSLKGPEGVEYKFTI